MKSFTLIVAELRFYCVLLSNAAHGARLYFSVTLGTPVEAGGGSEFFCSECTRNVNVCDCAFLHLGVEAITPSPVDEIMSALLNSGVSKGY